MKKIKVLFVSFLIGLSSFTQIQADWNPLKTVADETSKSLIKRFEEKSETDIKDIIDVTGQKVAKFENKLHKTLGRTNVTVEKVKNTANKASNSFDKASKAFGAAETTALKIGKLADKTETLITLLTYLTALGILIAVCKILTAITAYVVKTATFFKKKRKIKKDTLATVSTKKKVIK